jgi:hypothetical protein
LFYITQSLSTINNRSKAFGELSKARDSYQIEPSQRERAVKEIDRLLQERAEGFRRVFG